MNLFYNNKWKTTWHSEQNKQKNEVWLKLLKKNVIRCRDSTVVTWKKNWAAKFA